MKLYLKKIGFVVLSALVAMSVVGCGTQDQVPVKEEVIANEKTDSSKEERVDSTEVTATYPVTFTDSRGVEITLNEKPSRIVSLAPSTTEILYFLGVEETIVGRTAYCTFPESIADVAEVGGTSDPNLETIVDLDPDLVVASTHTSQEVMTKLDELGIPVAFLNEQENFEGTYNAIRNIGLLVGEQAKAEEVITTMQTSIQKTLERVEKATKDGDKPKVYYMVWYGDSDSTAGGDTFIGEMITLAGGNNVAKDVSGWSITKEVIAEQDPDMIIVPSGNGMLEGVQTTEFYKDLRAVKEGQVYEINQDIISRQGPRLAEALEALAAIIHPVE